MKIQRAYNIQIQEEAIDATRTNTITHGNTDVAKYDKMENSSFK